MTPYRLGVDADRKLAVKYTAKPRLAEWPEIVALAQKEEVLLGCVDADVEAKMKDEVEAKKAK